MERTEKAAVRYGAKKRAEQLVPLKQQLAELGIGAKLSDADVTFHLGKRLFAQWFKSGHLWIISRDGKYISKGKRSFQQVMEMFRIARHRARRTS